MWASGQIGPCGPIRVFCIPIRVFLMANELQTTATPSAAENAAVSLLRQSVPAGPQAKSLAKAPKPSEMRRLPPRPEVNFWFLAFGKPARPFPFALTREHKEYVEYSMSVKYSLMTFTEAS